MPLIPSEPKSRSKVVVIDDEAPILDIISTTLRAHGYGVTTFTEPLKALAWLSGNDWKVDLIITDIIMPGQDGLALARTIRAKGGPVAILLISARISEEGLWGEENQNLPFLPKPFTTAELIEAVESTMARFPRQTPRP
jgi:two-component system phosphate regulon response regulator OmpR